LATWYYGLARGIDERPVIPNRERKSLGSETTFPRNVACPTQMLTALEGLAAEVVAGLRMRHLAGRTLTLKVKYADFTLVSRSMTVREPLADLETLRPLLSGLLARTEAAHRPVRLLGVSVSALQPLTADHPARQCDLFDG
jgi:DNA polymerase-4